MCFNTCSLSLFFCKLHVYCHIKSAFYNLFLWSVLNVFLFCYLTEPECCISVVHHMQKENKIPYLTCVLESVFCKADQVVTTEEESGPLPHMPETDKTMTFTTFSSRWMVFSPAFVTAPGNGNNALYPHSLISKKGILSLAMSDTARFHLGLVFLFLMGGRSSQIYVLVLKSIDTYEKAFFGSWVFRG